jgi:hypothetical protein
MRGGKVAPNLYCSAIVMLNEVKHLHAESARWFAALTMTMHQLCTS